MHTRHSRGSLEVAAQDAAASVLKAGKLPHPPRRIVPRVSEAMKACVLRSSAPVEKNPLESIEVPTPEPTGDQLLIKVHACGVCRTDLHVVEGELPPRKRPVTPGHQVVGTVERAGPDSRRFRPGDRVGVAWLHRTEGGCQDCGSGRVDLCDAPDFPGYTVDGGHGEDIVAPPPVLYT